MKNYLLIDLNGMKHLNLQKIHQQSKNTNIRYILEVDMKYSEQSMLSHNDILFLSEKMKIKDQEKLFCNLINKNNMLLILENLQKLLKPIKMNG